MPRSSTLVAPTPASPSVSDDAGRGTPRRRRWAAGALVLAAVVTALVRLPFLHRPLTSDESGYLLLASHWHAGTSLYGNYWVDRPPLLITVFEIAARLTPGVGDATAVHLLGLVAAVASVVLVGLLGRQLAPRRWAVRVAAVVLTVALLATPLFGFPETDGELLGLPFVLGGLTAFVAALTGRDRRRALVYAAVAGACGMAAVLVKQNLLDVVVYGVVAFLAARRRAPGLLAPARAFVAGAGATLLLTLGWAATRGTTPAGVWDAVVVFRLRASAVVGAESGPTTWSRLTELIGAFVGSGAAALVAIALVACVVACVVGPATAYRRRVGAPLLAAWAVIVWELVGVVLGGSYWLHYLTGLIPGLVLLVLVVPWRRAGTVILACVVAYVAVVSTLAWGSFATQPTSHPHDAAVVDYLRARAHPGDGVVVGFGHADIVGASGLSSPYPQLWSLPVRVRDPQLRQLTDVLTGPHAPRWVVVGGATLGTWGVDATDAQAVLVRRYVEQVTYGDWHVWELDR